MLNKLLLIGSALVPWVTLAGLVIHCLRDKREFRNLQSPKQDER